MAAPTVADWNSVKRILRYLKGTKGWGILYSVGTGAFVSLSDADWAGCAKTRRSTTGVVTKLGSGAVTWASRKQQSVALSTTEAELVAASEATKDLVWVNRVLQEMDTTSNQAKPKLLIDNVGTIKLIHNPEFHRRTKHIEIRHYFVRERWEEGAMDVDYVASEDQVADIMTKALGPTIFVKIRDLLGMCDSSNKSKK